MREMREMREIREIREMVEAVISYQLSVIRGCRDIPIKHHL
jgi:hypothetical protein